MFLGDEEFVSEFKKKPAAVRHHHVWVSGLLEHTLNVMRLASFVSSQYENVNRDMLITGAFLHDIGKIREYRTLAGHVGKFEHTFEGRLIGHLVLGDRMLREKAGLIESFPESKLAQLSHMILSHHGQHEWGAPVRPKTLEAVLLHYVDNIDAKANMFLEELNRPHPLNAEWTQYSSVFGTELFRGDGS